MKSTLQRLENLETKNHVKTQYAVIYYVPATKPPDVFAYDSVTGDTLEVTPAMRAEALAPTDEPVEQIFEVIKP